jgi:hypothetical protein
MPIIEIAKIQVRRGAETATGMPQLDPGEFGWAQDTQHLYIGKRVEEGAVDNNNSRILTDLDLKSFNIFNVLPDGTTVASTSSYKYQEDVSAIHSSYSTIATKLDTWASLTDFSQGVWDFSVENNITIPLQNALGEQTNPGGVIENNLSDWAPRSVMIPAGYYVVTAPIKLPPNTKIIGDGPGRTVIRSGGGNVIFQTVDSAGNDYYSMNSIDLLNSVAVQPKNIHLEGMSLESSGAAPLVSLDNVNGATLVNMYFGYSTSTTATNTIGVAIRDSSTSEDVYFAFSANINIENCKFNGLDKGVYQNTGTTNSFNILNNEFTWMNRGIEVWSDNVNIPGPVNGVIEDNVFDIIFNEALYIGSPSNTTTNAYVLSTNNTYRDVGNGGRGDPKNPSTQHQLTSVIAFNNLNNRSVNDYFARFSSPMDDYNYPVVRGHAYIQNTVNYGSVVTASSSTEHKVASFALNEFDQLVTINYTLVDVTNTFTSRTGNLTMNIVGTLNNTEAFASVSDYYNFADVANGASGYVQFSTDHTSTVLANYVSLTCWNFLNQYVNPVTGLRSPITTPLDFKYQFNILQ